MLVDAAVQLCIDQGYDNTTVEQIAAAADVSPRTFSRYFPTKEAVMMTVVDDLLEAAVVELAAVGAEVPPLTALAGAHIRVLRGVSSGAVTSLTAHRLVLTVNVISSSSTLRLAATATRLQPLVLAVAARTGLDPGDRRVTLIVSTWAAVTAAAWGQLVIDPEDYDNCPAILADQLNVAFTEFSDIAACEAASTVSSAV